MTVSWCLSTKFLLIIPNILFSFFTASTACLVSGYHYIITPMPFPWYVLHPVGLSEVAFNRNCTSQSYLGRSTRSGWRQTHLTWHARHECCFRLCRPRHL